MVERTCKTWMVQAADWKTLDLLDKKWRQVVGKIQKHKKFYTLFSAKLFCIVLEDHTLTLGVKTEHVEDLKHRLAAMLDTKDRVLHNAIKEIFGAEYGCRLLWRESLPGVNGCKHPEESLVVSQERMSSGEHHHRLKCNKCGHPMSEWLPKARLAEYAYPVIPEERLFEMPECERCHKIGAELHHWGPKEKFGDDVAETWPTSFLCPQCHREWHKIMTPRATKKSEAVA